MKKKLRLVIILGLVLTLIFCFISSVENVSLEFCKYDVNNTLNSMLCQVLFDYTSKNKELINSICEYSTQDGKIKSINVNSHSVSLVSSEISKNLLQAITSLENDDFGIPIGNAFGLAILSGRGFKLKIKTVPIGNIAMNTESMFVSAGINQTLFKLVLNIRCAYQALSPFAESKGELAFSYTLCEAVIVGDVPELYLN